jgi:hypothetical protein
VRAEIKTKQNRIQNDSTKQPLNLLRSTPKNRFGDARPEKKKEYLTCSGAREGIRSAHTSLYTRYHIFCLIPHIFFSIHYTRVLCTQDIIFFVYDILCPHIFFSIHYAREGQTKKHMKNNFTKTQT